PRRSRRDRRLAVAVLPVAAQGRRLRYCRLQQRPSLVRHAPRFSDLHERGEAARPARHYRTGGEPHFRPTPVVSEIAPCRSGQPLAELLRVERYARPVSTGAHHLQGLRAVELDLGPGREGLLLASFLLTPARPEFRKSRSA